MKHDNCKHLVPSIKAWLDGELEAEASGRLEQHLDTCEACRNAADDYRAISRRLQAVAAEPPPPPVVAIRRRIERVDAEKRRAIRLLQGVAAAAAAVLIVTTTLALWKESVSAEEESARHDDVMEIVLSSTPWEGEY